MARRRVQTGRTADVVVRRDVPSQLVIERRLRTTQRGLLATILMGGARSTLDYLVRDDRIYTRRRRHRFADVLRVTVTRRSPRKGSLNVPVTLVMRDGSPVVVSDAPGRAQARATAEFVTNAVGAGSGAVDTSTSAS